MSRTLHCLTIAILSLAAVTRARADVVEAPQVTPGHHVYVVPDGWQPDLFGPDGVAEVEAATAQLRYPFYVVIFRDLPGTGDRDQRASQFINGLAEQWTAAGGYDPAVSQIFFLSYEPRAFRFLGGARWKDELGLTGHAWDPETNLFVRSVQSTPKDPKSGIIAMMRAVDERLLEATDTGRIAARQHAAAVQALDAELARLAKLLSNAPDLLPADLKPYRQMLVKAEGLRKDGDTTAIAAFVQEMKAADDPLAQHVQEAENDQLAARIFWIVGSLFALGLVIACFVWISRRKAELARLTALWEEAAAEAERKVTQALANYGDFSTERDTVAGLKDGSGVTAEAYARVTDEANDIYMAVAAYGQHIRACKDIAAAAGLFRHWPLIEASAKLEAPFTFDTGHPETDKLFAGATKVVTVTPAAFLTDLEARYKTCRDDWKELVAAAMTALASAQEHFPVGGYEALAKKLWAVGVTQMGWLSDHPLHGDEAVRKSVYANVEALRGDDPLGFYRAIVRLKLSEAAAAETVARLEKAIETVKVVRVNRAVGVAGVKLESFDDPAVTLDHARDEDHQLTGLLAGVGSIAAVEKQAEKTAKLYAECITQEAAVLKAFDECTAAFAEASAMQTATAQAQADALACVEAARKVHAKVEAETLLESAATFIAAAKGCLEAATKLTSASRHLDAWRASKQAEQGFGTAQERFAKVVAHCKALDVQKAEYEKKLAGIEAARAAAAKKIKTYGGTHAIPDVYVAEPVAGPVDYLLLAVALDELQTGWSQQAAAAQQTYDAAHAVSHSSSYASSSYGSSDSSSSYSSPSTDWGGGGGGDIGGSFGGGGGGDTGGGW